MSFREPTLFVGPKNPLFQQRAGNPSEIQILRFAQDDIPYDVVYTKRENALAGVLLKKSLRFENCGG